MTIFVNGPKPRKKVFSKRKALINPQMKERFLRKRLLKGNRRPVTVLMKVNLGVHKGKEKQ